MRMVLLLAAAAAAAPPPSSLPPERVAQPSNMGFVTVLDDDCTHGGRAGADGYQFVSGCAAAARSPDGRFAIRQEAAKAGAEEGGGDVTLTDATGRPFDDIDVLHNGMPFVVFWAPRGDWFFVNHYQGSGHDRLRLFEVVNRTAVERSDVYADVVRAAVERYPCLSRHATVAASGWRWSRDGRRILLVAYARPDACALEPGEKGPAGHWEALWMIGDVGTGRVQRDTVRVRGGNGEPLPPPPHDGPYADF